MKEIEIHGCCEVPEDLSYEEFYNRFIDFLESNGWYFGGSIDEYNEDKR